MPVVSGGTYRSPLTVIDNEADQIYINAINKITAAGAARAQKKIDQETERQKAANEQIQWTMDWTMKQQDKYLDQLKKAGNNNPQLASMFMEQINMMGDYAGRARQASTPEEQRALLNEVGLFKQRLSAGAGSVQLMNDALTTFNEDAQGALNTEGNLNLSNPEALEWAKKMAITAGRNPGNMTWFIDKDGDWAVRHEGPRLEKPTETKADVFFAYDPGTIPEYTKDIKEVLYDKLKLIDEKTGKVADQYLTGQMIEGSFVPTADYIDEGNGMMREVFLTDMKKVAQQLTPQLNPIADAYATDYYDAEGFYDSLPKNIKEKIMKEQGIGEDLKVGNAQGTRLDQKSLQAVRQGLLLTALPLVTKVRMGKSMKQPKGPGTGAGSGSGSRSGSNKVTVEDINKIIKLPIKKQVEHVQSLLNPGDQEIKYNAKNNTVTEIDLTQDPPKETVYYLGTKTGEEIPGAAGDAVGGKRQWEDRIMELYAGETEYGRKLKLDWRTQQSRIDPNTGDNIPYFLLNPDE